jgi:hypothetical protein
LIYFVALTSFACVFPIEHTIVIKTALYQVMKSRSRIPSTWLFLFKFALWVF